MKIILRLFALLLFVIFFGFALKNTDEVVLHLYWNAQTKSPLILLLLAFFVVGAAMGVLAMTSTVLRYKRELANQKKLLARLQKNTDAQAMTKTNPPLPDIVIEQVGL